MKDSHKRILVVILILDFILYIYLESTFGEFLALIAMVIVVYLEYGILEYLVKNFISVPRRCSNCHYNNLNKDLQTCEFCNEPLQVDESLEQSSALLYLFSGISRNKFTRRYRSVILAIKNRHPEVDWSSLTYPEGQKKLQELFPVEDKTIEWDAMKGMVSYIKKHGYNAYFMED